MTTRLLTLLLLLGCFVSCTDAAPDSATEDAPVETSLPQPGTEPATTTKQDNNIYLETNSVGDVEIGAFVEDLVARGRLKKDVLQTGEGDFDIWVILHEEHGEIGYVMEDFQETGTIGSLHFTSEVVRTDRGLGVGSTWQELRQEHPDAVAHGSEIEGYTSTEAGGFIFELDARHWSYEINQESIQPDTKVTALVVMKPR
ncbi:hypothetical protein [Lewinella sp. W8]|uniref:hypothetical protein n=1 Tax=Lewinella sp. W8 TaxID=2528208 RepID=UPI001068523F|nr:hypothetical protein [Lewinella sp. W8]MTB53123.1 hypothetical protein [Lewinella sp. W8]